MISVAHVAPIFSTTPPQGYGGVERVIEELTARQVALHPELSVKVYAAADSTPTAPSAGIVPSIRSRPSPLGLDETFAEVRRHYDWAIPAAIAEGADVIHLHGPWGLDHLPDPTVPTVVSIYDDTRRPDVTDPLLALPENVWLVANSRSTRDKAPFVPWDAVVLEGVIVDRYPVFGSDERSDRCLFVGELVYDKGLDIAIDVAAAAGLPLQVIGRPRMLDVTDDLVADQQRYLAQVLYPHLGPRLELLGEMGEDRLQHLGRARALLAPARIEEPFGRVCAEAMACGTPVIMFDRGSAPEIVADGVSGFVVGDVPEMVEALRRTVDLDPEACRRHARRVLDMDRVAGSYAEVYQRVLTAVPRRSDDLA